MADWIAGSGWHGGQPGGASIADAADAFQRHVTRPLGGPLVGLLQQQGAHQPHDGGLDRECADNAGAVLELAVQALGW